MTVIDIETGRIGGRDLADGVGAYLGIPYAAPPVGAARWSAPRRVEPWAGVLDATRPGPAAPQLRPDPALAENEDCLTLSVWTGPGENRPVLFWIHGGRFAFGSNSDPTFDGAALAAQGLTVVVPNYRLGALGFLAHPELGAESGDGASGNYGLLDQIAALHWVARNIATFGADPGRVTIAGQSAGAACVLQLLGSPLATGTFHRAIALSGARHPGDPSIGHLAPSYRTLPDAEADGERFVAEHGGTAIADLRALPWEAVVRNSDPSVPGVDPPRFRPVRDGVVIPGRYLDALEHPVNAVPVLTGTTRDEDGASANPRTTLAELREFAERTFGDAAAEFLALYPAATDAEAGLARNDAARDWARCSTWSWAMRWSQTARTRVYTSFWTHAPPGDHGGRSGAFHESELPYVFGNPEASWTATDRDVSATLARYVVGFVANGDPNGDGLEPWRPAGEQATAMELGDDWGEIPIATLERRRFWVDFLERGKAW